MTPRAALKKLVGKGFTLREIAGFINGKGVEVSYSTLSRVSSRKDYPVKHAVALALLDLASKE